MPAHLHLFGLEHLLILAAVPLLAVLLAVLQRRLPPGSRALRFALADLRMRMTKHTVDEARGSVL